MLQTILWSIFNIVLSVTYVCPCVLYVYVFLSIVHEPDSDKCMYVLGPVGLRWWVHVLKSFFNLHTFFTVVNIDIADCVESPVSKTVSYVWSIKLNTAHSLSPYKMQRIIISYSWHVHCTLHVCCQSSFSLCPLFQLVYYFEIF